MQPMFKCNNSLEKHVGGASWLSILLRQEATHMHLCEPYVLQNKNSMKVLRTYSIQILHGSTLGLITMRVHTPHIYLETRQRFHEL